MVPKREQLREKGRDKNRYIVCEGVGGMHVVCVCVCEREREGERERERERGEFNLKPVIL